MDWDGKEGGGGAEGAWWGDGVEGWDGGDVRRRGLRGGVAKGPDLLRGDGRGTR